MNASHTIRTALTAALAGLLLAAAPAHADSEDDFPAALQNAGIMLSGNNTAPVLAKAHGICADMNPDRPAAQLAKAQQAATSP